jgi:hypothetical protein
MSKLLIVSDLRPILQAMYPDVEDGREDHENYEHPMTAVGLVLMSAAIMDTTQAAKLIRFTGYSRLFLSAITFNMQNNQIWIDGRYDASTWLFRDGTIDAEELWTHIEIACANQWVPDADPHLAADPCKVYWDERRRPRAFSF